MREFRAELGVVPAWYLEQAKKELGRSRACLYRWVKDGVPGGTRQGFSSRASTRSLSSTSAASVRRGTPFAPKAEGALPYDVVPRGRPRPERARAPLHPGRPPGRPQCAAAPGAPRGPPRRRPDRRPQARRPAGLPSRARPSLSVRGSRASWSHRPARSPVWQCRSDPIVEWCSPRSARLSASAPSSRPRAASRGSSASTTGSSSSPGAIRSAAMRPRLSPGAATPAITVAERQDRALASDDDRRADPAACLTGLTGPSARTAPSTWPPTPCRSRSRCSSSCCSSGSPPTTSSERTLLSADARRRRPGSRTQRPLRAASEQDLRRYLLECPGSRVVEARGVKFKNRWYTDEALRDPRGRRVELRRMPHDARWLEIYLDGRLALPRRPPRRGLRRAAPARCSTLAHRPRGRPPESRGGRKNRARVRWSDDDRRAPAASHQQRLPTGARGPRGPGREGAGALGLAHRPGQTPVSGDHATFDPPVRHHANPPGVGIVETEGLLIAEHSLRYVIANRLLGALTGVSGTGKTFTLEELLRGRHDLRVVWIEVQVKPTMLSIARAIALQLLGEIPTAVATSSPTTYRTCSSTSPTAAARAHLRRGTAPEQRVRRIPALPARPAQHQLRDGARRRQRLLGDDPPRADAPQPCARAGLLQAARRYRRAPDAPQLPRDVPARRARAAAVGRPGALPRDLASLVGVHRLRCATPEP